jgi:hypothetical protein
MLRENFSLTQLAHDTVFRVSINRLRSGKDVKSVANSKVETISTLFAVPAQIG